MNVTDADGSEAEDRSDLTLSRNTTEELESGGYVPLVDGGEMLNEPLSDKAMINVNEFLYQFYPIVFRKPHSIWTISFGDRQESFVLIVRHVPSHATF